MNYQDLSEPRLREEYERLLSEYEAYCARGLSLDLSRGKPSAEQLDEVSAALARLGEISHLSRDGADCRNYGYPVGLPEMRAFWAELTGLPAENIVIGGNSSLQLMYDTVARAMLFGVADSVRPWCREKKIKFLCPTPGYDRHFAICEAFGIEMISVPLSEEGPDMDRVEALVASDDTVRGMWCVPKYSNPSGITYSDDVVRRLARMRTAAPDFRIFWDNAYLVHDLDGVGDTLLDIYAEAVAAGNENRIFYYASTSKITFPGAGVAMMAMSHENLVCALPLWQTQTIGYDKLNQLRHLALLPDREAVEKMMEKHAEHLRPRFAMVEKAFTDALAGTGIADWTHPRGGYFVTLTALAGTAKRVYSLCRRAGVVLTAAGATHPYGADPEDSTLRIAPAYPTLDELSLALSVLTVAVRLAALEKLLKQKTE